MSLSLPFVPVADRRGVLPKNAPAPRQFSRLLDALVVLDAQGACSVAELAGRVGLDVDRMRELLVAFMVAADESLGPDAPFHVSFAYDEEDEDARVDGDTVVLSSLHGRRQWLLGDLGLKPVMVRDVARAALSARLLVDSGHLPPQQTAEVEALAVTLADAMQASVGAMAATTTALLHRAVDERCRVRFRYLHPWTAQTSYEEVEPYALRRQRDRLVLDAGPGLHVYDVGGMSEVAEIGEAGAFPTPVLPPAEERTPKVAVVLRVRPGSSQDRWLENGWGATVIGPRAPGTIDVEIVLDGDPADPGVVQRLGVLLLQLGPSVRVVSPEELASAAVPVGRRLLEAHGG